MEVKELQDIELETGIWYDLQEIEPPYDLVVDVKGSRVDGTIEKARFSSQVGDWLGCGGDPTHFRLLENKPSQEPPKLPTFEGEDITDTDMGDIRRALEGKNIIGNNQLALAIQKAIQENSQEISQEESTDKPKLVSKWKTTPLMTSVFHEGQNPIFGEAVYHVSLQDEAGGPFVRIKAMDENQREPGQIEIDFEVLEVCLEEARKLMKNFTQKHQEDEIG